LKNIKNLLKEIEEDVDKNACKILVGDKCDKEEDRKITFEEGSKLAAELNMKYFETSAKSNLNVDETFAALAKEILHSFLKKQ